MCKCISYSIQRKSSQVTPRIHFCFDLLMVMGARPPYAWMKKRTNFLGWLLVEIFKKWCAVSNYPIPGVIWDRTKLAISQLLVVVERWNFLGVIWAWNAGFWLVTMNSVANHKKLFQKNLKCVSSHPKLRCALNLMSVNHRYRSPQLNLQSDKKRVGCASETRPIA